MQPNDFGSHVCYAIMTYFQVPNFCNCAAAPLGGNVSCSIFPDFNITTAWQYFVNPISIPLTAVISIMPCSGPAFVGFKTQVSATDILGWPGQDVRDCYLLPPRAL